MKLLLLTAALLTSIHFAHLRFYDTCEIDPIFDSFGGIDYYDTFPKSDAVGNLNLYKQDLGIDFELVTDFNPNREKECLWRFLPVLIDQDKDYLILITIDQFMFEPADAASFLTLPNGETINNQVKNPINQKCTAYARNLNNPYCQYDNIKRYCGGPIQISNDWPPSLVTKRNTRGTRSSLVLKLAFMIYPCSDSSSETNDTTVSETSAASRNGTRAGTIFLGLVFAALFIGTIAFTRILFKDRQLVKRKHKIAKRTSHHYHSESLKNIFV